jgi:Signal transduction histidine kinase regulating citrate/malate metabolism
MKDIYIIFECIAIIFETFIVYQYINSFFRKRKEHPSIFVGYTAFSIGLMLFSFFCNEPLILIAYTAVGVFTLQTIYYDIPILSRIFSVFFFAILVIVAETICAGIISNIGQIDLQETRVYGLPRILSIVISILIELLIIKLSSSAVKRQKNKETAIDFKQTFPLILAQIFSIALAYHVFIIGQHIEGHLSIIVFLSMSGILYINIIVFWYFDMIKSSYKYKSEKEAAEITLELQKQYYETLEINQYETDALWHDMKKHLDMIKTLVDNGDNANSQEYINELEMQIRGIPKIVKTSQPIISALLTEKLRKAKNNNINIELDVRLENELKVKPIDLCVLLGNLFDNALEACCGLTFNNSKYIKICLAQKSSAIFIEIKNTYDLNNTKPLRNGKRGFGLKNIRRVVDKYDGDMEIFFDNTIYQTTITIP